MDLEQQPNSVPAAFECSSSVSSNGNTTVAAAAASIGSVPVTASAAVPSRSTPPSILNISGSSNSSFTLTNNSTGGTAISNNCNNSTSIASSVVVFEHQENNENINLNSNNSSNLNTVVPSVALGAVNSVNNGASSTQQQQISLSRNVSLSPSVLNNSSSPGGVRVFHQHQLGVRTPPPALSSSSISGVQSSVAAVFQGSATIKDKLQSSAGAGVSRLSSTSNFMTGSVHSHQQNMLGQPGAPSSPNPNTSSSMGGMGSTAVASPRGLKRKSSLTNNAAAPADYASSGVASPNSSAAPPNKSAAFGPNSSNSTTSNSIMLTSSSGGGAFPNACPSPSFNLKTPTINHQQLFDTQGVAGPNFDSGSFASPSLPPSNLQQQHTSSPPVIGSHSSSSSTGNTCVGGIDGPQQQLINSHSTSSTSININSKNSNSNNGILTSTSSCCSSSPSSSSVTMCCRVFSTSILHKAEHYLSRGLSHNLLSFHAGESNSFKFLPPATEDDKKKIEIKAEAQEKYCTSKTNTAIANMKALTDSIPTPRSWGTGAATSGSGSAVSTVATVIGATSLNSMLMDTPHVGVAVGGPVPPPHSLPPPSLGAQGHPQQPPAPTSVSSANPAIKQENDSVVGSSGGSNQGSGSSSSSSSSSVGNTAGSNTDQGALSQDILSKRAIKTEYLKTLKKSLLSEELQLNETKHGQAASQQGPSAAAMAMHQQAMHLNAAAMHPQHHRMLQHMVGGAPGGPPGMMGTPAGGNQTANAVALAAANRAAAMRQQDFIRQQQQQHNHANCVQGMCMHQMPPPGHPARQMMAMAGPQPPGGMMGAPPSPYIPGVSAAGGPPPMSPLHSPAGGGPPGMRPAHPPHTSGSAGGPVSAAAAAAHMMKCRPGCNTNGVHNMLSSNGAGTGSPGNFFMPPGAHGPPLGPAPPSMYPPNGPPPPNSSRANAIIVPPSSADAAGMMSAGPAQPLNPSSFSNPMQSPTNLRMPPPPNSALPIRQMVPPYMHNMMTGVPTDSSMNMPPPLHQSAAGRPPISNPYPPSNGPPMGASSFQQRMPGPQPPPQAANGNGGANSAGGGGGGNNPMINVIMTIGSGHGNTSNVASLNPQQTAPGVMTGAGQAGAPLPPTSFAMQSNAQMMLDPNSGIPMKAEGGGGVSAAAAGIPANQPTHASFQNSGPNKQSMFPNQSAPNESQSMGGGNSAAAGMNSFNPGGAPYHSNVSGDASYSEFYSNSMNQEGNRPLIDQQAMHAGAAAASGAPFDLDELNSTSMISGSSDQRQISVNVDKNMFMVQSNLNGAQFNVQGSALPQGPNLRTNVAVNMQVQSNRLAPMGVGAAPGMNQLSSVNKFPPNNFDPAGQGPPHTHVTGAPPSMQGVPPSQQMWPPPTLEGVNFGGGLPPHSMSQRVPPPPNSFDVYSNLSEFKPISDTPKGTVEYLPDGKTREKSKEHQEYPPAPQQLPPHSNAAAAAVALGAIPGPNMMAPPPDFIATSQTMMMTPHQIHHAGMHEAAGRGQAIYDPSSTFTDFNFTAM